MKKQITINTEPISSWFSRNWKTIAFVVVISVLVWFVINSTEGLEKKIIDSNKKIEKYNNQVDSVNIEIAQLKERQKFIKEKFTVDSLKYLNLKIELTQIRKKYDEKINTVDGYTDAESQKFFSDRYPE